MTVSDQMFPKQMISEHLLVAYGKLTDIFVMSPAHSQLLREATKITHKYRPFHINSCYCHRIATLLVKATNQLGN